MIGKKMFHLKKAESDSAGSLYTRPNPGIPSTGRPSTGRPSKRDAQIDSGKSKSNNTEPERIAWP